MRPDLHVADEEREKVDGEVRDDGHKQIARRRVRSAEGEPRRRRSEQISRRISIRVQHAEDERLQDDGGGGGNRADPGRRRWERTT